MSKRSESFDKRFDELSRVYSDPVEVLFKIASGVISMGPDFINEEGEPVYMPVPLSDRRAAASDLCSYRYSKRKAIEIADSDGNEGFSFVMIAPGQKPFSQQDHVLSVNGPGAILFRSGFGPV